MIIDNVSNCTLNMPLHVCIDPEVKTNRFKTTMAVKGSTALHLVAGKGHDMAAMLLLDPKLVLSLIL